VYHLLTVSGSTFAGENQRPPPFSGFFPHLSTPILLGFYEKTLIFSGKEGGT
jgi:hypothetical protein